MKENPEESEDTQIVNPGVSKVEISRDRYLSTVDNETLNENFSENCN